MSAFIRVARSVRAAPIRPAVQPLVARSAVAHFTTSIPRRSEHAEETFEEFSARFEKEFDGVQDVFELQVCLPHGIELAALRLAPENVVRLWLITKPQRNLNNAFAYDLVPAPSVIAAALKAARRVNDFGTAVRIFEGIKSKVENKGQYEQYLEELKPLREELGVLLKEELYPEEK
ncbi:cytochrome c oxidase subunit 6 mitochondrial [Fusarium coicis]|nr:cytochrome c oxidase subunit 6 mitochondrial [Fusarium coicis]